MIIKQMADALEQFDIFGAIVTPPAAALHRLDLGKARFPEAQNVLRQVEVVGDLADRPESVGALFHLSGLLFAKLWPTSPCAIGGS
jgi:hypothetical protein